MRLTLSKSILLLLLILVIIYLIFIAQVFFLTLNQENRNSNSQKNITISVPKEAHIGDEIEVVVYYYPNLLNPFLKQQLKQIIFNDNTKAYSYNNSLNLENSLSLGLLPYHETFTYKVPQQVCPQEMVYDSCKLKPTKAGQGMFNLIYEPVSSGSLSGEGYQGDGEKIEVPINIIRN